MVGYVPDPTASRSQCWRHRHCIIACQSVLNLTTPPTFFNARTLWPSLVLTSRCRFLPSAAWFLKVEHSTAPHHLERTAVFLNGAGIHKLLCNQCSVWDPILQAKSLLILVKLRKPVWSTVIFASLCWLVYKMLRLSLVREPYWRMLHGISIQWSA